MKWMVYPASRYVSVLARYPEEIPGCEESSSSLRRAGALMGKIFPLWMAGSYRGAAFY